jgi:glycerol-3-phosphate dehydrogenase (NAD(P)+)
MAIELQKTICVLGSGIWGTAIATQIERKLKSCTIFTKNRATLEDINLLHVNKGVNLPSTIQAELDFAKLNNYESIIIASPSYALYEVISVLKSVQLNKDTKLIIATKGLDVQKKQLISQTFEKELNNHPMILSGASFADEVINNQFTAINLAADEILLATKYAKLISTENFVVIPCTDTVGLQLSGCMKNVIAILVGILKGLNYGDNLCSVIITKGIQEIKKLALKLAPREANNQGSNLAIFGDTILSCSSIKSRNMAFGLQLATGVTNSNNLVEGKLAIDTILFIATKQQVKLDVIQLAADCVKNPNDLRKIIDQAIPNILIC